MDNRCPVDGCPPPGEVGLDLRAVCPLCRKRVRVTVRGLYSPHKNKKTVTLANDYARGLADGRRLEREAVIRFGDGAVIGDAAAMALHQVFSPGPTWDRTNMAVRDVYERGAWAVLKVLRDALKSGEHLKPDPGAAKEGG